MSAIASVKRHKRNLIVKYARPDDWKGAIQTFTTLLPLTGLWLAISRTPGPSIIIMVVATFGIGLLLLRSFALMHDCGHGCLFRAQPLNRLTGFVFGVLTGMPQYVWAQHHNYHHAHNGNWARYRGPLSILSVDEFNALSKRKQRAYAAVRTIWLAPLAGLLYLIVNPRVNWLRGTGTLFLHLVMRRIGRTQHSFRTRYWSSRAEYWHMTANNLALLSVWAVASWWIGAGLFFSIYLTSVSFAGGLGIVLFTVQHNFEHSYASGDEGWDYDAAAIEGTSFLELPGWLRWFTADIGYHHIHHISARIPNYRLAACHAEYRHLFLSVKRLTISDVSKSLSYILWNPISRHLISVDELQKMTQVSSSVPICADELRPSTTA